GSTARNKSKNDVPSIGPYAFRPTDNLTERLGRFKTTTRESVYNDRLFRARLRAAAREVNGGEMPHTDPVFPSFTNWLVLVTCLFLSSGQLRCQRRSVEVRRLVTDSH